MNAPTSMKATGTATPRTHMASPRFRLQPMAVAVLMVVLIVAPTGALAAPDTQETDWTPAGTRWIEINLSEQWLTAYEGATPVFGAPVSTGGEGYETPEGEYFIEYMLDWADMWGYDYYYPDVPYVMYFADYLAIHGAYWHDNFGSPMSHGCVNLSIPDAAWIYDWASIGTGIWIHY